MYIDAIHDRKNDLILVAERVNGERIFRTYPAEYTFYYPSKKGHFTSIFGEKLSRTSFSTMKEFQQEIRNFQGTKLYESDINPIFRCLAEYYLDTHDPILNIAVFDIETGYDEKRGFADPWDTFNEVTAISVHLSHLDELVTLTIKPPTLTTVEAKEIAKQASTEKQTVYICKNEAELLTMFLDLIDDADVLTGWNSTEYDIPYLINRIIMVLGNEATRRFCLWGQKPRKRKYKKFKRERETYDLIGRVHLDYLDLYKKHNPQELHSYKLDYVGEIEVKENKIPYEGTLDDLYKRDYFKFIKYSQQDVMMLVKISRKCKYIELANQIAHTNTVLLQTTMGSVALIEQAIINEAHLRGLIVPDRNKEVEEEIEDRTEIDEPQPVVGAYVADPIVGLHKWIGAVDINSLYPSTLRALNMGPETLVGQIRPIKTTKLIEERLKNLPENKRPDAWLGLFSTLEFQDVHDKNDELLIIDFEDGTTKEVTAKQLYSYIFEQNNPFTLSANGTIFRTDKEAVIPGLLRKWYSERKEMQLREKTWDDLSGKGIVVEYNINIDEKIKHEVDIKDLFKAIEEKNYPLINTIVGQYNLKIENNTIKANDNIEAKYQVGFWNQRQQARKFCGIE